MDSSVRIDPGVPVTQIEIFDPPMCCPAGVCGPVIDPALIDIYGAIIKVEAEYESRVAVERYALGQQAAMFMRQPEVIGRLKTEGVTILPITVVDGIVRKERAYPSYDELKTWIEGAAGHPSSRTSRHAL